MRKKLIFFILLLLAGITAAHAYDFSAVAPTGQTLYYTITSSVSWQPEVMVIYPGSDPYDGWGSYNKPDGSLIIPSAVTDGETTYSVTSIGDYTFYGCRYLSSVDIPNSVTSIGDYTFYGCSDLASVDIPNSVTSIGNYAFYGCSDLASVDIPNSVTWIGMEVFAYCSELTSITVSSGNTEYDSRSNCNAIIHTATNTLVAGCQNTTIPNSVTSIGESAFNGCSSLVSMTIPDSVVAIGYSAFESCNSLASVTIPNSVTSIGERAFSNCRSLASVTIPNSVTSIGNSAFYQVNMIYYYGNATGSPWGARCVNGYIEDSLYYTSSAKDTLIFAHPSIVSASIPNSVTSIENDAFWGCSSLASVTIGNSVTSIGSGAFGNCIGLTSIIVSSGNTVYDSRSNCNAIIHTATNTLVVGCQNTTIPNSVTSIGYDAFSYCSRLASVSIPNSVTSIGNSAFCGCTNLRHITIPNSVTSIGNHAFASCTSLTSIAIPNSVTHLGECVFLSCSSLNSVVIPNSVTSIGYSAFWHCTSLVSVNIPNSVASIGSYAFWGCTNLRHITIPNSVTSIGDGAFQSCISLYSINIPDSVITIGNYAFSYCQSLDSVSIGNSVTSIGIGAFDDCSDLYSITIPNSVTTIGAFAFRDCRSLIRIIAKPVVAPSVDSNSFDNVATTLPVNIPCGSSTSYASNWSHFSNFNEVMNAQICVSSINSTMGSAIVVVQPTCNSPIATVSATPNSGYCFTNWTVGGTIVSTDTTYTFTVTSDITLTANFVRIYSVLGNASPSGGGSVMGAGNYTSGSTCTLTTTPASDYTFTNWTIGSTVVSTNSTYSFTVTSNLTLTANFVRLYSVSANASPSGGGSVTGAGNYTSGSTCTLTATPASGYTFTNWTIGGTVVSVNSTYSFTVTSDRTLTANFVRLYSVSANASPSGGGSVMGAGNYTSGSTCTLTAIPASDYTFTNWTIGSTVVSTNSTYSFTVTSDRIITANFTINCTEIPSYNYSITPSNSWNTHTGSTSSATCRKKVYRFMAEPYFTYTFKTGCNDGATANYDTKLYLYNASGNQIAVNDDGCESNRSKIEYTATTSGYLYLVVTGYGTAIGSYTLAYKKECPDIPNYDYSITPSTAWSTHSGTTVNTCNGRIYRIYVSVDETYTFKTGCGDGATASFDTYLQLYDADGNLISSNDDGCSGTLSMIEHTPTSAGYVYLRVKGYGGSSGIYTLAYRKSTNIGTTYTVTTIVNPAEGGTVTGAGNYNSGSTCTLTAIPASGYTFTNWTNGDTVVSTDSTYSFTVTSDRMLTANFAATCPTPTNGYVDVTYSDGYWYLMSEGYSLSVSWEEVGSATEWIMYIEEQSDWGWIRIDTNYYNDACEYCHYDWYWHSGDRLSMLLKNYTHYRIKLASVCGDDTSSFLTIPFNTSCDSVRTLTMGFEDDNYYLKCCNQHGWGIGLYNGCLDEECERELISQGDYDEELFHCDRYIVNHTPGGKICLRWQREWMNNDFFVLPPVDTNYYWNEPHLDIPDYQISFWVLGGDYFGEAPFVVGVMTNPHDTNTFVGVDTVIVNYEDCATWKEYTLSLESFTGNGRFVALKSLHYSYFGVLFMDDIKLEVRPDCPHVQNLTARASSPYTAEISWTESDTATNWQVYYSSNFGSFSSYFYLNHSFDTIVSDNTISLVGLQPNTGYVVRVEPVCSSDFVGSSDIYFHTPCIYLDTLPYFMDFEDEWYYWNDQYRGRYEYGFRDPSVFLNCWNRLGNGYLHQGYPYVSDSNHTSNGSYGLTWNRGNYDNNGIVVLPGVDTTIFPMQTLQLSFWAKSNGSGSIVVGVMSDPYDVATFVATDTVRIGGSNEWTKYITFFDSYSEDGVHVALKTMWIAYSNYIDIDDVKLEKLDCRPVENIVAHFIAPNSVSLSWNEMGSANSWEVQYLPENGLATDTVSFVVYNSVITLTGLEPNTTYTFWVTPICLGTAGTKHITYYTPCTYIDNLPYSMGFEESEGAAYGGYFTPFPVDCWHRLNNGTSSFHFPYVEYTSSYNHTPDGHQALYWYFYSNSSYSDYSLVALPGVNTQTYPVNTLQLSFWAKSGRTNDYNSTFYVGVMTDPNNINTLVTVDSVLVTNDTTWHEYTVTLDGYTGNGAFVTLKTVKILSDWWSVYVDDVTLSVHSNACSAITAADLPYTDNFDSYTTSTTAKTGVEPPCWTLAKQDVAMADEYKPMVYYSSANAHSGNYSLILNKRGIYAMPEFNGEVNTLQLSFYLKQPQTKYQLQVGVMSSLSNPNSFVPIATINNSTTSIEQVTVDFSSYTGNGHYIAFRNILAPGNNGDFSCNYIDDLTLELRPVNTCTGIDVADLPYTDNFDSYTNSTTAKTGVQPDCWTLAKQDVAMTDEYKPMIYYSSANAHSGNYSLILNKRGIYAMPYFDGDINTLQLSMYVKQGQAKYQLQVGVMSDLNNASTFVPVATINNNSTAPVLNTVSFANYTGSGHYIAFRNTLAPGNNGDFSCNYIDDLTLNLRPVITCTGINVADLPYTDNFDSYTTSTTAKTGVQPDCWTLAKQDVAMTDEYKPMIYYYSTNAHSGSYSLILNKRGIYAMPEFNGDVNTLQLSFYLKQPQTKYQLQVGVMSSLTNPSTFVPIATINNSTTSIEQVSVDLSSYTGNGHYIAFRNILASGNNGDFSCNYIDDLTLELRPVITCTGINVTDLPYTDNFDSYTNSTTAKTGVQPPCWTLAKQDVAMTDAYKPMIYYSSANAHSGNYSLIINKRGIYAMPEFNGDVNTLQLSFYLKQSATKYQLQVGVMSSLSNPSTFVPVATINNSTTGIEHVTIDFSSYTGNGHYIAFRNILAPGNNGDFSCNYIDDLTLSQPVVYSITATANPTAGGTVTGVGSYTSGSTCTLTATPNANYTFTNWTVGSTIISTNATYSFTVTANRTVKANFTYTPPTYTVTATANPTAGGTVTGTGNYTSGSTCTLTATAASGYTFTNWTESNTVVSSNASYSFTVTANRTLTANFTPVTSCGISLSDLPYTESFDNITTSTTAQTGVQPPCWTLAYPEVSMTDEYKPMVYYNNAYAHSGNYSLLLNKRGIYAMPEFDGNVSELIMGFYVLQTHASYYLTVGVMDDLTDPSTYTPVASFNNSSTTEYVYCEVDFSTYEGNGRYIVFRNINSAIGDYSVNYIDDITLNRATPPCALSADDLPYTDNFDSYTTSTTPKTGVEPTCWSLAYQEVTMTDEYKPMVYYSSANAHSGSYALLLNKRGIYAMPAYTGEISTLQLSFYLKQTRNTYDLTVGVMEDLDDPETFEPVITLSNSTTDYVQQMVDFSGYTGTGHYIVFRNINSAISDFSINYIDDLVLETRPDSCSITATELPYTDNFDSYTSSTTAKTGVQPDCWTLVHQDVAMTDEYKPMIYYNTSCAHSGNYSIILNKRCIYAMPIYEGNVNTLQMEFYVRQTQAKYQLQVGVLTSLDDYTTFTPVATINNSSTTTSTRHVVDFSSYTGTGRYIAFRNILASGQTGDYSCNYIDDITLSTTSTAMPKGETTDNSFALDKHLTVYPNPTTGKLTLEADQEVVRVDVFDYTGRNVATYQGQTTLDLSHLATGLYTLRITLPDRIEIRRVVKQ